MKWLKLIVKLNKFFWDKAIKTKLVKLGAAFEVHYTTLDWAKGREILSCSPFP